MAIIRNGSTQTLKVKLGPLPDDKQAKADVPEMSKEAMAKYGMALAPASAVEGAGKTGVVVADVDPDGAAAQKGIRTGDVILEVAGKPVARPSDVTAAIDAAKAERQEVGADAHQEPRQHALTSRCPQKPSRSRDGWVWRGRLAFP